MFPELIGLTTRLAIFLEDEIKRRAELGEVPRPWALADARRWRKAQQPLTPTTAAKRWNTTPHIASAYLASLES